MQGNQNIIDRLFNSFTELETAINSAKATLAKKESVPQEIIERLNSYDDILAKQRHLAETLCSHIDQGEWDEVNRHVSLINGLSAMIRDDARAILSSLALNSDPKEDEEEDLKIC
ncbi:MAG: hypothetical protein KDD62_02810 [Bdellovibrionales bacterium]|nr:hypothetical protein [Bdellovibrionales bacterium]